MSELISGKEALIALANGEEVQFRRNMDWNDFDLNNAFGLKISDFKDPNIQFRLKPKTITINGIEVPAPFEPKEGDIFYNIQPCNDSGWMGDKMGYEKGCCDKWIQFGAWRTEEEIKQVVKALRSIFK